MRRLGIALFAALLVSCGGGSGDSSTDSGGTVEAMPPLDEKIAVIAQTLAGTSGLDIGVAELLKTGERRIGRTTYEYVFRVRFTNLGVAAEGVTGVLTRVPSGTQIVDGVVAVGNMSSGASSTPADTITIRHDRTLPFNAAGFVWAIQGRQASVEAPQAIAILEPGVRVLSAAEESSLADPGTDSRLYFSSVFNTAPGSVILSRRGAFRVVAVVPSATGTVVQVTHAALEEVFSRLRIKGRFTQAQATELESDPTVAAQPKDTPPITGSSTRVGKSGLATASRSTIALERENLKVSGEVEFSVETDVDYSFDKYGGGVLFANVRSEVAASFSATAQMTGRVAEVRLEQRIKRLYIPIPVTILSPILAAVGIEPAGLFIPIDVGYEEKREASFTTSMSGRIAATGEMRYSETSGFLPPTLIHDASGRVDVVSADATGEPVGAQLAAEAGIYLKARPALSFVNQVALAGVEVKGGIYDEVNLKVTAADPFFCLSLVPQARLSVLGFAKAVRLPEQKTEPVTVSRDIGSRITYGNCKSKVLVLVDTGTLNDRATCEPATVNVRVESRDMQLQPGKAPGGSVRLALGTESCTANLAGGVGACSIRSRQAGLSQQLTATYSGDDSFDPDSTTAQVAIRRARTATVLTTSPNPSREGQPVEFRLSVVASPDRGCSPGGTASALASDLTPVCSAALDGLDTGACTRPLTGAGTRTFLGSFGGSPDFEPSRSAATAHNVLAGLGRWQSYETESCLQNGAFFFGCSSFGRAWRVVVHCESGDRCLRGTVVRIATTTVGFPGGLRTEETSQFEVEEGSLFYQPRAAGDATPGFGTYSIPLDAGETIYPDFPSRLVLGTYYVVRTANGWPGYVASASTAEIRQQGTGALLDRFSINGERSLVQNCQVLNTGHTDRLCVTPLP